VYGVWQAEYQGDSSRQRKRRCIVFVPTAGTQAQRQKRAAEETIGNKKGGKGGNNGKAKQSAALAVIPKEPKVKMAKALHKGMLSVIGEVKRANGETAYVGSDGQLYQKTHGAVEALVPMEERFAREWQTELKAGTQCEGVLLQLDGKMCPPSWALHQLHEDLFSRYPREVGVLNAVREDGTFFFVIPEQEGTAGGIDIDDALDALATLRKEGGRCVGITHCHPGLGTCHSWTDAQTYELWNGIHPILSSNGKKMRLHASVRGHIWRLGEQDLKGAVRPKGVQPVKILRAGDRDMDDLLRVPKPFRRDEDDEPTDVVVVLYDDKGNEIYMSKDEALEEIEKRYKKRKGAKAAKAEKVEKDEDETPEWWEEYDSAKALSEVSVSVDRLFLWWNKITQEFMVIDAEDVLLQEMGKMDWPATRVMTEWLVAANQQRRKKLAEQKGSKKGKKGKKKEVSHGGRG
jgi:proteasome lid subunit RPN8/RPN11